MHKRIEVELVTIALCLAHREYVARYPGTGDTVAVEWARNNHHNYLREAGEILLGLYEAKVAAGPLN